MWFALKNPGSMKILRIIWYYLKTYSPLVKKEFRVSRKRAVVLQSISITNDPASSLLSSPPPVVVLNMWWLNSSQILPLNSSLIFTNVHFIPFCSVHDIGLFFGAFLYFIVTPIVPQSHENLQWSFPSPPNILSKRFHSITSTLLDLRLNERAHLSRLRPSSKRPS